MIKTLDSWDSVTLLVASKSDLLKINPDAVGGQTYDTLMVNGVHNITSLAYDSYTHSVYFSETYRDVRSSRKIGTISRFYLNDPGKV